MNSRYETVIIGGGPAGLTAAYFLAKAGRQACVVEQKKEIGNLPRLLRRGYQR